MRRIWEYDLSLIVGHDNFIIVVVSSCHLSLVIGPYCFNKVFQVYISSEKLRLWERPLFFFSSSLAVFLSLCFCEIFGIPELIKMPFDGDQRIATVKLIDVV